MLFWVFLVVWVFCLGFVLFFFHFGACFVLFLETSKLEKQELIALKNMGIFSKFEIFHFAAKLQKSCSQKNWRIHFYSLLYCQFLCSLFYFPTEKKERKATGKRSGGEEDKLSFTFIKKKYITEAFNLEKNPPLTTNQSDSTSHKYCNIFYAHPQRKS